MIRLKPIFMQGLVPTTGQVDFGERIESLLRSPPNRPLPYVACNLIGTLDGRATVGGSTEALGFHTDARVLMRMRTFADAVVIGAGTMRVEQYERMLPVPRLRGYREQIGLPADPLTVLVSHSMQLPWEASLFTDGHGTVIIATTSSSAPPSTATEVEVMRYRDTVDLEDLLGRLRRERGVESISCEGGPTLFRALVEEGLVDDLFLTHNPVLVGEGERGLIHGPLGSPVSAELTWVLEAEGELFTRWRVNGARADSPID
jgi:riboflavin biosynthesis pyrimidine reductase